MIFKIGCSGFSYKEWKGIFYPEKLPAKDWLQFYCTQFNTLEINSTFYRLPAQKSLLNWYAQSPADFLFSVKASKFITHIKRFVVEKAVIDEFYLLMNDGLKEKLGCILFQMPPSFHFSEERLQLIVEKLNPAYKNVVEFRHKSWWTENVFDTLARHHITFCGQSYPGDIPAVVVQNTSTVYYRFHGKPVLYKSLYDEETLQSVFEQISEKAKEVFIYFNNTWGESAIINARQLQELL